MKIKIIFLAVPAIFFLSLSNQSFALTMSNANYILQMGTLSSGAGTPSNTNYKLGVTIGQTAPGLFSGTNYKVRSGFQYIHSIIRFRFTISQTTIDFGLLLPTNPVIRTNTLTLSNGSANGYAVTASENHALRNDANNVIIPNTTCDSGACTPEASDSWTNTLTYGFGYRCDNVNGTDCAPGFSNATAFKQFAATPSASIVMTGRNVGRNKKVTITYKVNIGASQAAGTYQNIITYIATPSY